MLFIALATFTASLTISINDQEFTGNTFADILSNLGSCKSTIQSLIVKDGQFLVNDITTAFSQLSTLHIPLESFYGVIPKSFLRNL